MDPELTGHVHAAAPYTAFLGLEIVAASPEEVRSRLAWSPDKCTAGGVLHGGALMSLADSAGGFLAFLNLPDGAKGTATIESKTNFLGPVREGYVHGVTRALHTGKRTIVVDTELFDDAGNTMIVIEHNLDVIKQADWIVDLGPEGGEAGGEIVAVGTPEDVARIDASFTGEFLRHVLPAETEVAAA